MSVETLAVKSVEVANIMKCRRIQVLCLNGTPW